MKLFYCIVFLVSVFFVSNESAQIKEKKEAEITKSLKILNIHDTKGPITRLA